MCDVALALWAGLPPDGVAAARLLMDAEKRTAFHFLISNLGGGGSSFFSSAAGPSLVSIALMAQRPYLDARRPSDAAARSATARSSDATVQARAGPSVHVARRARAATRSNPFCRFYEFESATSGDSSLDWPRGVS